MSEFRLPLLPAELPVEESFAPMIRNGVSGVVIHDGLRFQILHYSEILSAWQEDVQRLGDIRPEPARSFSYTMPQARLPGIKPLEILGEADPGLALVRSSSERIAAMYLANSPGCCCDGPGKHCYPPNNRGSDDNCVVDWCAGKLTGC